MKLSEALSSYWAQTDGLRGCPGCRCLAMLDYQNSNYRVECKGCGIRTIWFKYEEHAINDWNQRTADPIIRELQARLELAKGALEYYATATYLVITHTQTEANSDHGFSTTRFDGKKNAITALATLSTDEWISKP